MSEEYGNQDAPHYDYRLCAVPGIEGQVFRGPIPDLDQPYIACIGGAQTFGRFVADPFPNVLSRELGVPCLNLGLGGAGPRFALDPPVLRLLQGARLVVVQMFSGRSASNSLFDNSDGRNYGRVVGTDVWQSYEDFLTELMARADQATLERTVRETRDDYAFSMRALGRALGAPCVLLWLSRRAPAYAIDWSHPFRILNHYPQLIDAETVEQIRPAFDGYVECSDAIGLPQPLWHSDVDVLGTERDDDGRIWNHYYPSPEMHAEAAAKLLPVCTGLLDSDVGGKAT